MFSSMPPCQREKGLEKLLPYLCISAGLVGLLWVTLSIVGVRYRSELQAWTDFKSW
ncbi:unnamed protein product [Plutella xylostella]|uniref:(diamondback moth) hypothetical protein n=1 Tax=Plutella xylostella TaxID=51655 RepID=A0A8S4FNC2_PLUXY|nr:unnamed protein product [Plutella xylostella]